MKTVGVIGGMGPKATVDFLNKVIALTPVEKDQKHIKMIVYMNPEIPDRTEAIVGNGESPLQKLTAAAKFLEDAGVDFIVMPCVTAHYWLDEMKKSITIPILDIVELTLKKIKKETREAKKIGILATTGAVQSKIFERVFEPAGYSIVIPGKDEMSNYLMKGIDEIKAGKDPQGVKSLFRHACDRLLKKSAEVIILACTEIPLSLTAADVKVPLIDVNEVLAHATVQFAFNR